MDGIIMMVVLGVVSVFGLLQLVFLIRVWDLVTEASEYFARENERYRREYERRTAASE